MAEERLKLAVFIDFDNIQIGVKDTLGKDLDVSLVLEALKERGEVVTKVAYGDWHRAGDQSRQMTQHAVQMVQRNVTPRGDKNGADINLALDALEMAFNRSHINTFAIVGGDSDFIALVEKLKQYDKRVFVVGGRAFTSNILQRNCTEFIAYENLLKPSEAPPRRATRRGEAPPRASLETRPLPEAFPNVQRALKILAEREVSPQLGLIKSTLLQLDSTFSERTYGASTFLEFMQKMEQARLVHLRRIDRGYLVELADSDAEHAAPETAAAENGGEGAEPAAVEAAAAPEQTMTSEEAMGAVRQAMTAATEKSPNRPLYLRHIRQALRTVDKAFDERRAGFHGILDLLHQAQREGLARLQRDRKGVWRIFPASAAGAAPAGVPAGEEAAASADVVQGEAAASTDFWLPGEVPIARETTVEAAPEAAPGADAAAYSRSTTDEEESSAETPASPRKVRRPRSAKPSTKPRTRKASPRRKSKETLAATD
ncbi:MAG TPA: NYN domain-containing protein [Terriglobia bacterium]|nr:NYN domain-containing protein [Terriglobia bacterium]